MEFKDLMAGFTAKVGLSGLSSGDDGVCSIEIDGMVVSIYEIPEIQSLAICGEIGTLPIEGREQFYALMLRANYLGQGTGGATLSLSEGQDDMLCIHRVLSLVTADVESFFTEMERFVNTFETWKKLAEDYRPEASAATSTEPMAFGGDWLRA